MTDIPDDIMAAARTIADSVSFGVYEVNTLVIARALNAERERGRRNEGLLTEALALHQMIFDSFRGYIPDFEEAVIKLLRKAKGEARMPNSTN